MRKIRPLADDYVSIVESPDPSSIFCFSPGITVTETGRLIVTMDFGGPGVADYYGIEPKQDIYAFTGRIFVSDDKGKSWKQTGEFPYYHARPFKAGGILYILGQNIELFIIKSEDDGETWSEPIMLAEGKWHQAPCNVHYDRGNVYLVMEKSRIKIDGWGPAGSAPVLMKAAEGDDLTKAESWTFASEMAFTEAVSQEELDYFGVPFYKTPDRKAIKLTPDRGCSPIGWLETNVVQFKDENHYWYDPSGRTFHLLARANTHGTGYAVVVKVVENDDGTMTTMLETVPSGEKILFTPMPGGQMKFHILYDQITKLYWLLSSQATDSMTRYDKLPENRYGLPNNERHRLQLHFSKNCIDWCFAGLVAAGATQKQSRHYASMVIDGEDLHIASRSGDENAKSAHNGNMITFHTIKDFRELIY